MSLKRMDFDALKHNDTGKKQLDKSRSLARRPISAYDTGTQKFINDITDAVNVLKRKISSRPAPTSNGLPKEFLFIQSGLDGILDLASGYKVYLEKQLSVGLAKAITLDTSDNVNASQILAARKCARLHTATPCSTLVEEDLCDNRNPKRSRRSDSQDDTDSATNVLNVTEDDFAREGEWVTVFTDGSCIGNGKDNAPAGIGVWFNSKSKFNISEPVKGRRTNNCAEIEAAIRAIEQAHSAGVKKLRIKTDSMFLINCVTNWRFKWMKNDWKTAGGKPVLNKIELIQLGDVLSALPIEVDWVHVKAHKGILGNEAADMLARKGAAKS